MKYGFNLLLLLCCVFFFVNASFAITPIIPAINCGPETGVKQESSGTCADPFSAVSPLPQGSISLLLSLQENELFLSNQTQVAGSAGIDPIDLKGKPVVYFFWGKGCPHCEDETKFLGRLKRLQPSLEVRDYEVWNNAENAGLMAAMLRAHAAPPSGVPVTFVHDRVYSGFSQDIGNQILQTITDCAASHCDDPAGIIRKEASHGQALPFSGVTTSKSAEVGAEPTVTIPLWGPLDVRRLSLPVLTVIIAVMDSFNPCAFFVLLSLLGLLIHARSRNKILLIGGIFVFFSGFFYFIFMAAWLNLFLVMGHVAVITSLAGWVSVLIAGINIKDFVLFKQGISLTIPDSAKPKLLDRMRHLLRSTSLVSILVSATVLAMFANFYELLCTAGFPMIFTRILTMHQLPTVTYYLYLVLYNIVYVIPLLIIVIGFAVTLGKRQLTEWQGRVLKLISGTMMLGLGAILIINPALLNSVVVSFTVLVSSLGVSLLAATVTKRLGW